MIALARGAKGEDPEGFRAEFVRLAETMELLVRQSRGDRDEVRR
jgi:hypothetical protein